MFDPNNKSRLKTTKPAKVAGFVEIEAAGPEGWCLKSGQKMGPAIGFPAKAMSLFGEKNSSSAPLKAWEPARDAAPPESPMLRR